MTVTKSWSSTSITAATHTGHSPDPDVLALDLAGVPYWQARRVGVHRIGQLTKPDPLVVQIHRHSTLVRAGQTPRTRAGPEVLAAWHDGYLRKPFKPA